MSKRVTTKSTITDRTVALQAFKVWGVNGSKGAERSVHELSKTAFEIRSGRSTGRLDLTTGVITGDDMSFHESDFDDLKQTYAKEKLVAELLLQGGSIHSQTTTQSGDIEIIYQIG